MVMCAGARAMPVSFAFGRSMPRVPPPAVGKKAKSPGHYANNCVVLPASAAMPITRGRPAAAVGMCYEKHGQAFAFFATQFMRLPVGAGK
jgi:hypothetical protein